MAFEGAISSLGASRGLDGSIDRVPDPPPSLWNKLAFLSAKCETENIEILSIFEEYGADHQGMMKREKFCTALKDQFPRYHFTAEILDEICGHYGVGYKNPRGYKESVAWKDFCEDVLNAKGHIKEEHWAAARAKGATPGVPYSPPKRGWQPENHPGGWN